MVSKDSRERVKHGCTADTPARSPVDFDHSSGRADLRDARCVECGARCIPGQTHLEHNAGSPPVDSGHEKALRLIDAKTRSAALVAARTVFECRVLAGRGQWMQIDVRLHELEMALYKVADRFGKVGGIKSKKKARR